MKKLLFISLVLVAEIISATNSIDYSKGIFWVNEDWYGHQNSSVNYLIPDDPDGNYWYYRVIREENPGMELGCTSQFGALWNGKYYFISKQEKDPGASITGGRITVVDAETMKILHQLERIDPSGAQCDGRGFVGINEHKGYISSSNGVWIFDLDKNEVKGQVEGSANPYAGIGNDKPNTDSTGSLYHGQSGMMVETAGKIFIAHQQYGLLVADPEKDKVTDVISMDIVKEGAGIGSVVKSKDGYLWISVAANLQGTGTALNYIVRVDPASLDYKVIQIPEGMYGPANSWYAWTPDAFIASRKQNCLYWKGGPNRWFSGTKIYKYDIDNDKLSVFINLEDDTEGWKLYGSSMGCDPVSDELYMSLYHEFGTPTYIVRRFTPGGKVIRDYEMIQNYWFPSRPVFTYSNAAQEDAAADIIDCHSTIEYLNRSLILQGFEGLPVEIYDMTGIRVYDEIIKTDYECMALNLNPGIYIVKAGDKTKKIRMT